MQAAWTRPLNTDVVAECSEFRSVNRHDKLTHPCHIAAAAAASDAGDGR